MKNTLLFPEITLVSFFIFSTTDQNRAFATIFVMSTTCRATGRVDNSSTQHSPSYQNLPTNPDVQFVTVNVNSSEGAFIAQQQACNLFNGFKISGVWMLC